MGTVRRGETGEKINPSQPKSLDPRDLARSETGWHENRGVAPEEVEEVGALRVRNLHTAARDGAATASSTGRSSLDFSSGVESVVGGRRLIQAWRGQAPTRRFSRSSRPVGASDAVTSQPRERHPGIEPITVAE